MKRTDIEKNIGTKINNKIQRSGDTGPFTKDAGKSFDKREQRKLDQALGLVSFAVKINSSIVLQIQELAKEKQTTVNEVVAELLQKGLDRGI